METKNVRFLKVRKFVNCVKDVHGLNLTVQDIKIVNYINITIFKSRQSIINLLLIGCN